MFAALALIAAPSSRDQAKAFTDELHELSRIAACAEAPGPNVVKVDAGVLAAHCAELRPLLQHYADFWASNIDALIAQVVPQAQAKTVVYPFGGGDLVTALGTYPHAAELTTLSLEPMGDVRSYTRLSAGDWAAELGKARKNLELLYRVKHSKTDNMTDMTRGGLPGQLVFALTALAIRGLEPVALRYFEVAPDGTLDYLTADELSALDAALAQKNLRTHHMALPAAELEYKKAGETNSRVWRHLGANLDNTHVRQTPGILAHLRSKGRVFAMTKAASYLLWWDNFSDIRDYLSQNVDYMISDSTGLPPDVAAANGFKQYSFGSFAGPFLADANPRVVALCKQLWSAQPQRALPFRYGYPDSEKNAHMLVTTKLPWAEPK